ncbi:hypothetical protein KAU11_02285, partial [Candidatus Babeliales bacterium]|nr:hypothetical protein [Candidatus Babeliales bacterium]
MKKAINMCVLVTLICSTNLVAFFGFKTTEPKSLPPSKPALTLSSKTHLNPTELFSTSFYSDDSFFYGEDKNAQRYELYLKANYQNVAGQVQETDDSSQALLKMSPHEAAYDIRARFLFEAGKFKELAELPIFDARKWKTTSWETLLLGARALEAISNTEKANELFDFIVKKYSDKDQVAYFNVIRLLKHGNNERAIESIDSFLKSATLKSRHAIFYQLKASIFMQPPSIDPKKALAMITKSLELNPRSSKGWMTKIALHDRLGQTDKSITALRSILSIADDSSLRKALVEKLFKNSNFLEAAKELEKIKEKTPEHYFDLALLYWKSKNRKTAEKNINRSLKLNKTFAKARLLNIEVLLSQQKKDKALS